MRTLIEQADAVARREVSALELVERALERIAKAETELNAFTHVFPDAGLDEAARLGDQAPRGPLHGVPVVVKELVDVAGAPTTGCCAAYADRSARSDAAVVERLREAGAVVLAKTNQHELAFGATNLVSSFGATRNPWDPDRITGGSSGGSAAAVAYGAVACALGSDTGGSIRVPASFCGVTGLKPTHGSVSLRGVMPLAPTLDTVGPLCLTAEDCILVHRVISGFDPDDPWSSEPPLVPRPESLHRARIAILRRFLDPVAGEVRDALQEAALAFERAGAVIDEVEGPDPDDAWEVIGRTTPSECAHHHPGLAEDDRVDPGIREMIAYGASMSADDYLAGRDLARKVRRDFEWALTSADALLVPTTAFPATRPGDETIVVDGRELDTKRADLLRLTSPANVARLPAISFPIGFSPDGLPLGAQLIGREGAEELLCAFASAYQGMTDHHIREPQGEPA